MSDFDFKTGRVLRLQKEGSMESDLRLDDKQVGMINQMVEMQGMDEREAKIRVMCIAVPPDHYKAMPSSGRYPRMVYRKDGKTSIVGSAEDHQKALASGWSDEASQIHVDRAQGIKPAPAPLEVPVAMTQAVEKQRARAAK